MRGVRVITKPYTQYEVYSVDGLIKIHEKAFI